ncbi:MAG: hypothetical protein ABIO70_36880 [Pseudomonadota bacterium]
MLALLTLLACRPAPDTGLPSLDWTFAFALTVAEYRDPRGGEGMAWATVDNRETEPPPWDLALSAGDCGYYEVRPWQDCTPACTPGEACSWDGACIETSDPIDAGVITVAGLSVGLVLTPLSEWVYYGYEFEPEPANGEIFAAGNPITASAAGAALPAFELQTLGVAPLGSDLPCPLPDGQEGDLTLHWTPGQDGDRVRLSLTSANHGSQYPAVVCDTEDDGALAVDAALLEVWQGQDLPVPSWRLERVHEVRDEVEGVPVALRSQAQEGCSW